LIKLELLYFIVESKERYGAYFKLFIKEELELRKNTRRFAVNLERLLLIHSGLLQDKDCRIHKSGNFKNKKNTDEPTVHRCERKKIINHDTLQRK